ncbi:hypothetical protein [Chryseobacterium shandongense]|uniref:hypothetical protein n=1 Tax=Chryseobacterium shandongense TaxID=1493872 RepID=UPI001E5B010D|nr:hypothetical protein [Chryseobacterium shandongense]
MIYFKLPFDETLYSTDNNPDEKHISFHPFDGAEIVTPQGKIITVNTNDLDELLHTSLPKDGNHYTAETKDEYLQNLTNVIHVIKENQLPKLVYSRRKIITDFQDINLKKVLKIFVILIPMPSDIFSLVKETHGWVLFPKCWENLIKRQMISKR